MVILLKCIFFPFQEFQRSSIIRQIDLWGVKYFVMAFTLHDAKMLVVAKCLQERALPNVFFFSNFSHLLCMLHF